MSFDKVSYQREYMKNRRAGSKTKLQVLQDELESNKNEIERLKTMLDTNNIGLESNKESLERECLFKGDKCYINMPKAWAGKKVRISIKDD